MTHQTIDRVTQGIHHTTEQLLADRNVDDGAGSLHDVALLDQLVVTEHDDTDVVRLQVQCHTLCGSEEDDRVSLEFKATR